MVFWEEGDGCYWMLVGAKRTGEEGSVILKYTSKDLKGWELQGSFYESGDLYFMECPDVFRMGDFYYLVFSWNNVTYYRMAESLNGPWQQPESDTFDGNAFYAAKTVEYEGSRYLAGFIDRKQMGNDRLQYSWAGSLCVHELVQKTDGTLGVKMPHQQAFPYDAGGTYEIKLIVENEVVVVYVDDTKALSNRIYKAVGNQWGIAIPDGAAEISGLAVRYK